MSKCSAAVISVNPISSRKLRPSILTVGCRSMNAHTRSMNASITPIAITIAMTMTARCCATPTAVMIESSENTASSTRICTTAAPNVREPCADSDSPVPSSLW